MLTVAAVMCLVAAIVFAVMQCSGGNGDKKTTTAPSTKVSTAAVTTQAQIPDETEAVYTEPIVTEAPATEVYTEAPTEAPQTQAPETQPVVTEAPAQEETETPVPAETQEPEPVVIEE